MKFITLPFYATNIFRVNYDIDEEIVETKSRGNALTNKHNLLPLQHYLILYKNDIDMFGDLMGNLKKQQEELKGKLAQIHVEAESGGGAVKVTASAERKILHIQIDKSKLDWEDVVQVQDLVLVAVNKAIELAAEKEQAEAKKLVQDMLPPGLGGLAGMFR